MQDIISLSVFGKIWEKPTFHRFLELICIGSFPSYSLGDPCASLYLRSSIRCQSTQFCVAMATTPRTTR